ncbi:DUF3500 domain-containing protein [Paraglaciecola sp. L3A3]|uniref:DUF3500 domain-containing protein n=1 Tax=Paraglaciecola sp. L3A3 TaxID=2686358 RepID=UPI00131D2BDF|nr:DUF3500 domain-containing protein [Paraglaciecola sp. L3A3]
MTQSTIILFSFLFYAISTLVSASQINNSAQEFVDSLSPMQKSTAIFKYSDEQRFDWKFVPAARKGIPLKQLNEQQKQQGLAILHLSLSKQGYQKATNIIGLEQVLFLLSGKAFRDDELYYISIFGKPSQDAIWGWRFEGHHLSLNFTIKDGNLSAVTPNFWGANPAKVATGEKQGLRVLQKEEDLGRELINSLSAKQQTLAIISDKAYGDILTKNKSVVSPLENKGIFYQDLNSAQKQLMLKLISVYLDNMPENIALSRYQNIQKQSLNSLQFAWAGSTQVDNKHYYRIQGDTFLIEYDNVQQNGNHIHTVWRDFKGDFGRDILKEHHTSHQH